MCVFVCLWNCVITNWVVLAQFCSCIFVFVYLYIYEILLLPIELYWPSSVGVFLCLCIFIFMKLCYYQLGCIGRVLRKQTASLRRYNSTSLHLRLVWNAKMKLHISAKQDETILYFCWYRLVQLLFLWQTQVWSLHSLNCPSTTPFFVSLENCY